MITAKEKISGCFQALEVAKGHATPSSVAIASRKRNLKIPEAFLPKRRKVSLALRFE